MYTWIKRVLAPPVFEDEEQTRIARSLNTILLATVAFAVVYGIGAPFLFRDPVSIAISAALVLPLWLGALWLMRRGQVRLAAWLFLSVLWAALTFVTMWRGANRASALGAYVTIIFTAGLLLGERGGLSFVVLSTLSSLGMFYAETSGILVTPSVLTPFDAWASLMTHLTLATMVLYLVVRNINDAFALAKSRERALAERAAELAQMNRQLEQEIGERLSAEQAEKQAEDELRHARQRQRLHFEQTPLGMLEWDLDFRVVDWNPAAEAIFGFSKSEVLGQHASLIVPNSAREHVYQVWNNLLAKRRDVRSINENVRRDGRVILCEWYNTLLVDDAGNIIGAASLVQDVTQRKQAEDALRESELKFRSFVEQSVEGFFLLNEQGVVIEWNPALENMTGVKREEVLGQFVWDVQFLLALDDLNTPATYERAKSAILNILRTGQVPQPDRLMEAVYRRRDGSQRVIQQIVFPIKVESGFWAGVTARDITERKRMEEALHRQLQESTALHAIAAAGAAAIGESELIEQATQIIGELLYSDNFGVMLLNQAAGILVPHPSYRTSQVGEWVKVKVGQGVTGTVAQTGRLWRVSDVNECPEYIQADTRTRSELCVPLKLGESVIGVINIESVKTGAFSESDERLLMTVAQQLTTAIGKVRLFEAERRRRQEAETLQEIITTLTSTLELDQVLSSLLVSLERVIAYDSACVFLIEQDRVKAVAARGFPSPEQVIGRDFPSDNVLFQEILDTARPLILQDALADPRFQRWGGAEYVRGWLGVPMMVRGQVIGRLTLDSQIVGAYGAAEATLAQAFANQAAIAIENARLFEAERAARQRAETLHAATQALSATLDLQEVFELILSELQKVVPYDSASVQQLVGEQLKIIGGRGFPNPEEIIGLVFDPNSDDNPNREVIRTRAPLIVGDVAPYYGNFHREPHAQAKIRSWLGVPLIFQDRLLGMITLDKKEPVFYTEAHVRLALAFAAQAASALENAMLYTKTQEHASELSNTLVQLQELDRLKSEFIQNVSHELRTPLSIVLGYAEMLCSGELGELRLDQQEPVAIIARRGRMLKKMVEDLTAILEAEVGGLEQKPVDLGDLVTALLADFQAMAEKAKLALLADIEPDLPPALGDPTHLRRVIDNLMSNALKFTPAGGTVKVRLWHTNTELMIEVADTGIGIPQDKLEKIFERFYQVDGSMSRPYGGVGLGLALVKEIVEAHGGQVSVQSQLGQGTTFRVTLPG